MTDVEAPTSGVIYDAKHARRVEWVWWVATVFAVFFTVLAIVNKSLFTVVTIVALVGCVAGAMRWRSMSVRLADDDLVLRQFTRTERIPIAAIIEVGVTLPQLGTHPEAVYVKTADRRISATVTAFTNRPADVQRLREALEAHSWKAPEPEPALEPEAEVAEEVPAPQ